MDTDVGNECLRLVAQPEGLFTDSAAVEYVAGKMEAADAGSQSRDTFIIDSSTPHSDAVINESSVFKPGLGWVTVHATEGLRSGVHEWAVKVEHQGETNDGSGLMLGIVPKSFNRYDSFISQCGGWCISRAGKFYGHWRRVDNNPLVSSLSFGTNDKIIFELDMDAQRMTVRVGDKSVVGEISNLTDSSEVYPAVSLHYRSQHVRFEHRRVRDRSDHRPSWVERGILPSATCLLPLRPAQAAALPLDSPLFAPTAPTPMNACDLPGERLIAARAAILIRAWEAAAVAKASNARANSDQLPLTVTPELLRREAIAAVQAGSGVAAASSGGSFASNASSLMLVQLLGHGLQTLIQSTSAAAAPSASPLGGPEAVAGIMMAGENLAGLIAEAPVFAFSEMAPSPPLSPAVLDAAFGHLMAAAKAAVLNPQQAALGGAAPLVFELLVIITLQRGSVADIVAVARLLLASNDGPVTAAPAALSRTAPPPAPLSPDATNAAVRPAVPELTPRAVRLLSAAHRVLPPLGRFPLDDVIASAQQRQLPSRSATSTDAPKVVHAMAVTAQFVYVHEGSDLVKIGTGLGGTTPHEYARTDSPKAVLAGVRFSSLAVIHGATEVTTSDGSGADEKITAGSIILHTDRCEANGWRFLVLRGDLTVERHVVIDAVAQWPAMHDLVCKFTGSPAHPDAVLMVYGQEPESHTQRISEKGISPVRKDCYRSTAVSATMVHVASIGTAPPFEVTKLYTLQPGAPARGVPAPSAIAAASAWALRMSPQIAVDFGSPDGVLSLPNGHVTVELWVQLLPQKSTEPKTLYQHGDRAGGEVFIETATVDGVLCVRGGYRQDSRAAKDPPATAPLKTSRDGCDWIHVALVFDGRWGLHIDGELVATAKVAAPPPEKPRGTWMAGDRCVGYLAELRVWRGARPITALQRDSCRPLRGSEPGLLLYAPMDETSGLMVYDRSPSKSHGWVTGATTGAVRCSTTRLPVPAVVITEEQEEDGGDADAGPTSIAAMHVAGTPTAAAGQPPLGRSASHLAMSLSGMSLPPRPGHNPSSPSSVPNVMSPHLALSDAAGAAAAKPAGAPGATSSAETATAGVATTPCNGRDGVLAPTLKGLHVCVCGSQLVLHHGGIPVDTFKAPSSTTARTASVAVSYDVNTGENLGSPVMLPANCVVACRPSGAPCAVSDDHLYVSNANTNAAPPPDPLGSQLLADVHAAARQGLGLPARSVGCAMLALLRHAVSAWLEADEQIQGMLSGQQQPPPASATSPQTPAAQPTAQRSTHQRAAAIGWGPGTRLLGPAGLLFSPLAIDVRSGTLEGLLAIIKEHYRSMQGPSARRANAWLDDRLSPFVVTTALLALRCHCDVVVRLKLAPEVLDLVVNSGPHAQSDVFASPGVDRNSSVPERSPTTPLDQRGGASNSDFPTGGASSNDTAATARSLGTRIFDFLCDVLHGSSDQNNNGSFRNAPAGKSTQSSDGVSCAALDALVQATLPAAVPLFFPSTRRRVAMAIDLLRGTRVGRASRQVLLLGLVEHFSSVEHATLIMEQDQGAGAASAPSASPGRAGDSATMVLQLATLLLNHIASTGGATPATQSPAPEPQSQTATTEPSGPPLAPASPSALRRASSILFSVTDGGDAAAGSDGLGRPGAHLALAALCSLQLVLFGHTFGLLDAKNTRRCSTGGSPAPQGAETDVRRQQSRLASLRRSVASLFNKSQDGSSAALLPPFVTTAEITGRPAQFSLEGAGPTLAPVGDAAALAESTAQYMEALATECGALFRTVLAHAANATPPPQASDSGKPSVLNSASGENAKALTSSGAGAAASAPTVAPVTGTASSAPPSAQCVAATATLRTVIPAVVFNALQMLPFAVTAATAPRALASVSALAADCRSAVTALQAVIDGGAMCALPAAAPSLLRMLRAELEPALSIAATIIACRLAQATPPGVDEPERPAQPTDPQAAGGEKRWGAAQPATPSPARSPALTPALGPSPVLGARGEGGSEAAGCRAKVAACALLQNPALCGGASGDTAEDHDPMSPTYTARAALCKRLADGDAAMLTAAPSTPHDKSGGALIDAAVRAAVAAALHLSDTPLPEPRDQAPTAPGSRAPTPRKLQYGDDLAATMGPRDSPAAPYIVGAETLAASGIPELVGAQLIAARPLRAELLRLRDAIDDESGHPTGPVAVQAFTELCTALLQFNPAKPEALPRDVLRSLASAENIGGQSSSSEGAVKPTSPKGKPPMTSPQRWAALFRNWKRVRSVEHRAEVSATTGAPPMAAAFDAVVSTAAKAVVARVSAPLLLSVALAAKKAAELRATGYEKLAALTKDAHVADTRRLELVSIFARALCGPGCHPLTGIAMTCPELRTRIRGAAHDTVKTAVGLLRETVAGASMPASCMPGTDRAFARKMQLFAQVTTCAWDPIDLAMLCAIDVPRLLFRHGCVIFDTEVAPTPLLSAKLLSEPGAVHGRRQTQRDRLSTLHASKSGAASGSDQSELPPPLPARTAMEEATRLCWAAVRALPLAAADALTQPVPPSTAASEGSQRTLTAVLKEVAAEFRRTCDAIRAGVLQLQSERLVEHAGTILSLLCTTLQAFPAGVQSAVVKCAPFHDAAAAGIHLVVAAVPPSATPVLERYMRFLQLLILRTTPAVLSARLKAEFTAAKTGRQACVKANVSALITAPGDFTVLLLLHIATAGAPSVRDALVAPLAQGAVQLLHNALVFTPPKHNRRSPDIRASSTPTVSTPRDEGHAPEGNRWAPAIVRTIRPLIAQAEKRKKRRGSTSGDAFVDDDDDDDEGPPSSTWAATPVPDRSRDPLARAPVSKPATASAPTVSAGLEGDIPRLAALLCLCGPLVDDVRAGAVVYCPPSAAASGAPRQRCVVVDAGAPGAMATVLPLSDDGLPDHDADECEVPVESLTPPPPRYTKALEPLFQDVLDATLAVLAKIAAKQKSTTKEVDAITAAITLRCLSLFAGAADRAKVLAKHPQLLSQLLAVANPPQGPTARVSPTAPVWILEAQCAIMMTYYLHHTTRASERATAGRTSAVSTRNEPVDRLAGLSASRSAMTDPVMADYMAMVDRHGLGPSDDLLRALSPGYARSRSTWDSPPASSAVQSPAYASMMMNMLGSSGVGGMASLYSSVGYSSYAAMGRGTAPAAMAPDDLSGAHLLFCSPRASMRAVPAVPEGARRLSGGVTVELLLKVKQITSCPSGPVSPPTDWRGPTFRHDTVVLSNPNGRSLFALTITDTEILFGRSRAVRGPEELPVRGEEIVVSMSLTGRAHNTWLHIVALCCNETWALYCNGDCVDEQKMHDLVIDEEEEPELLPRHYDDTIASVECGGLPTEQSSASPSSTAEEAWPVSVGIAELRVCTAAVEEPYLKTMADQALATRHLAVIDGNESLLFRFGEGSGSSVATECGTFLGRLTGDVFWAPTELPPMSVEQVPTHMSMDDTERASAQLTAPSEPHIPRKDIQTLVSLLDGAHLSSTTTAVFQALTAKSARDIALRTAASLIADEALRIRSTVDASTAVVNATDDHALLHGFIAAATAADPTATPQRPVDDGPHLPRRALFPASVAGGHRRVVDFDELPDSDDEVDDGEMQPSRASGAQGGRSAGATGNSIRTALEALRGAARRNSGGAGNGVVVDPIRAINFPALCATLARFSAVSSDITSELDLSGTGDIVLTTGAEVAGEQCPLQIVLDLARKYLDDVARTATKDGFEVGDDAGVQCRAIAAARRRASKTPPRDDGPPTASDATATPPKLSPSPAKSDADVDGLDETSVPASAAGRAKAFIVDSLALLRDSTDAYVMEVPYVSAHGEHPVYPVFVGGDAGTASTVSFDSGRNMELLFLYADKGQKVQLAKFPDAQSSWPEVDVQSGGYIYAKPASTTKSQVARFTVTSLSRQFRVGIRLLELVVAAADRHACLVPCICAAPVILALAAVAHKEPSDSRLLALRMLTAVLKLWAAHPDVNRADQAPPFFVLERLLAVGHQSARHDLGVAAGSPAGGPGTLSPVASSFVQHITELTVAVHVAWAAWSGIPVRDRFHRRWATLRRLTLQATESSSCDKVAGFFDEPRSPHMVGLERISGCPAPQWRQARGVWSLSCDRGSHCAKSDIGVVGGRWYFEVRIPAAVTTSTLVVALIVKGFQFVDGTVPPFGQCAKSWCFDGSRLCHWHNGVRTEFKNRAKWKPRDVIGLVLDLEDGTLMCQSNGKVVGPAFENILPRARTHTGMQQPIFYPAVAFTGACELNFGAAPFQHDPPPGFLPLDCSLLRTDAAPGVANGLALIEAATAVKAGAALPTFLNPRPAKPQGDAASVAAVRKGRMGAHDVSLIPVDGRHLRIDGGSLRGGQTMAIARGSVAVTSGRWYFEAVVHSEGAVRVGWATSQFAADAERGRGVGDDNQSWAIDGTHTYAWSARQRRALASTTALREGDVLGCMLDCEHATVDFTVNGHIAKDAQDHSGGALFSNVPVGSGLSPAVSVDRDHAVQLLFAATDLHRIPAGYTALGPSQPLPASIATYFATPNDVDPFGLLTPTSAAPIDTVDPTTGVVPAFLDDDEEEAFLDRRRAEAEAKEATDRATQQQQEGAAMDTDLSASPPPAVQSTAISAPSQSSKSDKEITTPPTAQQVLPPFTETEATERVMASHAELARLVRAVSAVHRFEQQRPLSWPDLAVAVSSADTALAAVPVPLLARRIEQLGNLALLAQSATWAIPAETRWSSLAGPLADALATVRPLLVPHAGVHAMMSGLWASNGTGEAVKLTVNRRRALAHRTTAAQALRARGSGQSPLSVLSRHGEFREAADAERTAEAELHREALRATVFGQVYSLLKSKPPAFYVTTSTRRLWSVVFAGEGAEDVGGPYREALAEMCREMMSVTLPLFTATANQKENTGEARDRFTVHPGFATARPDLTTACMFFLGQLMAGCVRSHEPLSLSLPAPVWKRLVGEPTSFQDDMAVVDHATAQSVNYLDTIVTDAGPGLTDDDWENYYDGAFTAIDSGGDEVSLFPGGEGVNVTAAFAPCYLRLLKRFKLHGEASDAVDALCRGFWRVVPYHTLRLVSAADLERIVCGRPDFSVDELKAHSRLDGLIAGDRRLQFFWEALASMTPHERGLFARFVTGRERMVPATIRLKLMPMLPPGTAEEEDARLPSASTCFFWLSLPDYSSAAVLKERLVYAVKHCVEIDADFRARDMDDATPPRLTRAREVDDAEFEDFSHLR